MLLVSPVAYCTLRLDGGPQVVPVHTFGELQSAPDAHDVLQAVAPHRYGLHEVVVALWQTPAPLQVRAELAVDPVQLAPAHWVPDP